MVSCEKTPSKDKLIGKWLLQSTEYGTNSETIETSKVEGSIFFVFKANGKFEITDLGGSETETGNWVLSGDELRMAYPGESEAMIWTVKELTSSNLVLQMEAEKPMFYYRYVLTKVQ